MSDPLTQAVAALSSRRSSSRSRVNVTLYQHGGLMSANELATRCGWDIWWLEDVIFGDDENFSIERSPFALGQIVKRETPHGDFYEQTPAGRAEAIALLEEAEWERGRRRRVHHG